MDTGVLDSTIQEYEHKPFLTMVPELFSSSQEFQQNSLNLAINRPSLYSNGALLVEASPTLTQPVCSSHARTITPFSITKPRIDDSLDDWDANYFQDDFTTGTATTTTLRRPKEKIMQSLSCRRGPKGIDWSKSHNRQLARLYELTDISVQDIPLVMGDPKFCKKTGQDKLKGFLGEQPRTFRPKDEIEALDRIEEIYSLMADLKIKATSAEQLGDDVSQLLEVNEEEVMLASLAKETNNFGFHNGTRVNLREEIERLGKVSQSATEVLEVSMPRASLKSLESLKRRLASREPRTGMRNYSELAVDSMYFVMKRLSVASFDSQYTQTTKCTTGSSQRNSIFSVDLLTQASKEQPPLQSIHEVQVENSVDTMLEFVLSENGSQPTIKRPPICVESPPDKNLDVLLYPDAVELGSRLPPFDRKNTIKPVTLKLLEVLPRFHKNEDTLCEGLPFNYEFFLTSTSLFERPSTLITNGSIEYTSITHGNDCCQSLRRGNPRASLCPMCSMRQPAAHSFVSLEASAWQNGTEDTYKTMEESLASLCCPAELYIKDAFHDTALHTVARQGVGFETIMWLLEIGIDACAINAAGQTFMHVLNPAGLCTPFTAENSLRRLLARLGETGFNFNLADDYGRTPLHVFTQHCLPWTLIDIACNLMNEFCQIFPQGRDIYGQTIASQVQVQVLREGEDTISTRLKPSVGGKRTSTAILLSCPPILQKKVMGIYGILTETELGVMINQQLQGSSIDCGGQSALHCLAKVFLSYGTNANKRKREGDKQQREWIKSLISQLCAAGVDVNGYDTYGNTPLMIFVAHEVSTLSKDWMTVAEVLQQLLREGANVHRRNRAGETALHLAAKAGNHIAVKVLLENFANVHSRTNKGKCLLDILGKAIIKKGKSDPVKYARFIAAYHIAKDYGAIKDVDSTVEWDEQITCQKFRVTLDQNYHENSISNKRRKKSRNLNKDKPLEKLTH